MADLRLVLGPLEAIEDALIEAIGHARSADPLAPVTVVVGHTLLKRYLPRMLARRSGAHINVRFVLPDELAAEISADRRPHATPLAERLLVRLAADDDASGAFAASARGEGFISALRQLFRELERGRFSVDGLSRALAGAVPAGKAGALAGMYGSYLRRRERAGLTGAGPVYANAQRAAFEGPLLVYGVWAPGALQERFLLDLARGRDCSVFFPASGLDADEAHAAFRATLESAGARLEVLPADDGSLSARVFAAPGAAFAAGGVSLVSAPDTVREVWEAARACVAWAAQGIAFHEMAVVYRQGDRYRGLIDEIFAEAEIATYVHDGRPVSQHPLGRRLLLLLDLLEDETFSRQHVMEFLTETRMPRATRERHPTLRPAEWEKFTREAGIVAGMEQWEERLGRLAGEKRARAAPREELAWLAAHAERIDGLRVFVSELHARISGRPGVATWEEHLAFVRSAAGAYADGLEPLLDAVEELRGLGPVAERVPFETFIAMVRDDLDARDVSHVLGKPAREFGRTGVAVLDATSLQHLRFRAVYMLGVSERAWPAPVRPDPLLLEHERAAVNAASAEARLPLRTKPDTQALSFLLALDGATERLTISYARAEAGSSGRNIPSYYFRSVAQTIEGRALSIDEVEYAPCVRRFGAARLTADALDASLCRAEYDRGVIKMTVDGTVRGGVQALARIDREAGAALRPGGAISRALDARRGRWSSELTAYDGLMTSEDGRAAAAALQLGSGRAVSPSRLEMYAHCPYRYFLAHGLGLQDLDEPETLDRIDHLERGNLVHRVLERFMRETGRADPPSAEARDRHVERLLAVADEEARACEARGVTGRPLLWALDKRSIFADLVHWYDEEVKKGTFETLLPGGHEVRFGPAYGDEPEPDPLSSDAPLALQIGGKEVLLQGRIDRVDYDEGRRLFRVVDYKTGKSDRKKAAFDKGQSLQLAVYMHAAARALGIGVYHGEGELFFCTSRGKFSRKPLTGATLKERTPEFEQIVDTIVTGVGEGLFPPNPGKDKVNCRICDFKAVCDSRISHIAERKQDDARQAAYRAILEIP